MIDGPPHGQGGEGERVAMAAIIRHFTRTGQPQAGLQWRILLVYCSLCKIKRDK
jgi:hypothetical protein